MYKVVYECDRCNKEVPGKDKLHTLRFQIKLDDRAPDYTMDLCNDCMEELGFIEPKNQKHYISNYIFAKENMIQIFKKLFRRETK